MTQRTTGAPGPDNWKYKRESAEFGGNVMWGVTPNLSLNATVNPDFSQVEADVAQVVFDPRQAIAFPEKRPFFLEGSENFSVPNSLIYTRRIVAPEFATKVSGKVGGLNVGVLSAIDDESTAPGGAHNPIYNLARLRRDLGSQSHLGMVYTDKIVGDDYNRVAGIDTRLLIGGKYIFNGQVAGSFTRSGDVTVDAPLFDFTLTRTGRETGFNFTVEGVHNDFVAASGFIPRVGVAHSNFSPRRTWFPKNSVFQSITFSPMLDGTWEWDRFVNGIGPNDFKANTSTTAMLRGGWRTTVYTWTETFKYPDYLYTNFYLAKPRSDGSAAVDTVPYTATNRLTNLGVMLGVGTPQWRTFSGSADLTMGQDDNFDEWSSALILYSTLNVDWRPTNRIRVNGRYVEQRTHRKSDRSLVRVRSIPRVKVEYQITRPLFFRFVGPHDGTKIDALRDDGRTNLPILVRNGDGTFSQSAPVERSGFRADWLLSYQPNPGTVIFAGYGASLGSPQFFSPNDLVKTSDGFFVKLSYLLRM
jgi:hypothetical protein